MVTDPIVEAFEAGRVPRPFGHREHLHVAFCYLRTLRLEDALARYTLHLERLAAAHAPGKYHATMTWALLATLHDAMQDHPDADLDALLLARPELLDRHLLLDHYAPEELDSPRARARFVLPRRTR